LTAGNEETACLSGGAIQVYSPFSSNEIRSWNPPFNIQPSDRLPLNLAWTSWYWRATSYFLRLLLVNVHLNVSHVSFARKFSSRHVSANAFANTIKEFVVISANDDSKEVKLKTHTTDTNPIQKHTSYFPAISDNSTANSQKMKYGRQQRHLFKNSWNFAW
jgi:hypothetical protein